MAQLPDLHVTDSSEAMLSGRKPPFRLLVRAVASDGRKVNIRHAVSEGFVVCLLALVVAKGKVACACTRMDARCDLLSPFLPVDKSVASLQRIVHSSLDLETKCFVSTLVVLNCA